MRYFPVHLNVETSDYCNRHCAFCPVQRDRATHPPRLLDLAVYRRLLEELRDAPFPLKISLQWIDEPLANPRFYEYADLGLQLLPKATWLLQTNGDFLNGEHAESLKRRFNAVAINFYSESAYRAHLRHDLDLLLATDPERIQSPGRLERQSAARAGEAVFHRNLKFRSQDWVEEHDQVQVESGVPCMRLWTQAAISFDGNVHICCRDNLKAHPVGNLSEMSLFEAYNSQAAHDLRRRMQAGRRDEIAMCRTCPGAYVESFDALPPNRAEPAGRVEPEGAMPWGRYDYWTARQLAKSLGHVALPGFLPKRYEYVVGLTPALAATIVGRARQLLDDALVAIWVCGSRVLTRPRLKQIDPTVFENYGAASLRVGAKTALREFGPDPRYSSDLDVKVLVAEGRLDADQANRLGVKLGAILKRESPHIPISGHEQPRISLIRVPDLLTDPREAFAHYNAHRLQWTAKGPLSLEYVQLLHDPRGPDVLQADATAAVRAELQPRQGPALDLDRLRLPDEVEAMDEGLRLRARVNGLSVHQLIGALADYPELEPPSMRDGGLAAWAMKEATRRW